METKLRTLEEGMQNLSLGRSKDLSLVASIKEYAGPKTSRKSIQEFFEQVEQYGQISNWTEQDLVAIAISKLTGEAALYLKGIEQTERRDLTYDRLKELLTQDELSKRKRGTHTCHENCLLYSKVAQLEKPGRQETLRQVRGGTSDLERSYASAIILKINTSRDACFDC